MSPYILDGFSSFKLCNEEPAIFFLADQVAVSIAVRIFHCLSYEKDEEMIKRLMRRGSEQNFKSESNESQPTNDGFSTDKDAAACA